MDTKQLAAQAALAHLFKSDHFSICAIDAIAKLLGRIPNSDAYNTLLVLHCVSYRDMPPALRKELPRLVRDSIGELGFDFDFCEPAKDVVVETENTRPDANDRTRDRRPWLARLFLPAARASETQ